MQSSTFDWLTSLNKAISHRFWDLILLRWPMIVSNVLSRISTTISYADQIGNSLLQIHYIPFHFLCGLGNFIVADFPVSGYILHDDDHDITDPVLQNLNSFFNDYNTLKGYLHLQNRKDGNIHTSHACRTFRATWMASWTKGTGINFAADCKTVRISKPYSKGEGVTFVCQNCH